MLGRIASAVVRAPVTGPEPQHVAAWNVGADGEEKVGRRLQEWADGTGNFVLHDRRIARSKANIDHIALAPSGVWVIDTKEYKGPIRGVNVGGWINPDIHLRVAGRDKTNLAAGVYRQMKLVAEALDQAASGRPRPPVKGVLCFTGAEWPLLASPFVVDGVTVCWPAVTIDLLNQIGPWDGSQLRGAATLLARAFPAA